MTQLYQRLVPAASTDFLRVGAGYFSILDWIRFSGQVKFTYPQLLRRGATVDVVWFNDRGLPATFFEVEHSTDINNSLLKFVDFQDFRIDFRIVADSARRREYDDKIDRAAFSCIRDWVEFLDYEHLSRLHEKAAELQALEIARAPRARAAHSNDSVTGIRIRSQPSQ